MDIQQLLRLRKESAQCTIRSEYIGSHSRFLYIVLIAIVVRFGVILLARAHSLEEYLHMTMALHRIVLLKFVFLQV